MIKLNKSFFKNEALEDIPMSNAPQQMPAPLTPEQLKELESMALQVNELTKTGRNKEALPILDNILTLQPFNDSAMQMKAEVMHKLSDDDQALQIAEQTLKINPKNFLCHRLMGIIFESRKNLSQAEHHFISAIKITPRMPLVHKKLAQIYFKKQDWSRAVGAIANAVIYAPNNMEYKQMAVASLGNFQIDGFEERIKQVIQICMEEEGLTHRFIQNNWSRTLQSDPDFELLRAIPNDEDFDIFLKDQKLNDIAAILNDPFFTLGISRFYSITAHYERVLTRIRKYLILNLDNPDYKIRKFIQDLYPFILGMAQQCWINEYVYPVTDAEENALRALEEEIENECTDTPEDKLRIALLGSYQPLYALKNAKEILQLFDGCDDPIFQNIITTEIAEPFEEWEIKKTIPVHGTIDNKVSQDVQNQYEENPYPRWRTINKTTIGNVDNRDLEILIAGCGTGQQPASMMPVYPNAHFTCVDLSRTSLAYAIRQCRKLDIIDRLEFMQGDILQLGSLGKKFDIIYCSGVLHHMEDPEAGLAVLKSLLKPDGLMHISVYSEVARPHLAAAQEFIKKEGYKPTIDDIRVARQVIIDHPEKIIRECLTASDFFTTSQCRDLIFHVQEHRFTLDQIQDVLERHGLIFDGFFNYKKLEIDEFRKHFPEKDALMDLEKWKIFEQKNPAFFRNKMYNFRAKIKQ